jgi:hypothetical protein
MTHATQTAPSSSQLLDVASCFNLLTVLLHRPNQCAPSLRALLSRKGTCMNIWRHFWLPHWGMDGPGTWWVENRSAQNIPPWRGMSTVSEVRHPLTTVVTFPAPHWPQFSRQGRSHSKHDGLWKHLLSLKRDMGRLCLLPFPPKKKFPSSPPWLSDSKTCPYTVSS